MNNISARALIITALCTLALGVAIGVGWPHLSKPSVTSPSPKDGADEMEQEPKVLYWYDPMVPDQHFDKPGPSPFMDMELVPKYATQASQEPGLMINADLVQNLGMRTAKVQRMAAQSELEVTGRLQFNERDQAVVQLRANGFAEKVWPLAVGDRVIAGQPIAEFQIPEWLDVQNELLSQPVTDNPRLLKTLRTRLQLLGMPNDLIAQVEKTRQPETQVTITAPISGVVTMLGIKAGMALANGDTLVRINGLDSVWLDAAIPEAQASQLVPGDKATFHSANPDDPFLSGTLKYLLPTVDNNSRTLTARVELDNPDGRLKPGTSGRIHLHSNSNKTGLFVPTEAIIRTGKRALVMVVESGGKFRPVEVIASQEIGNHTRIQKGLKEGQEVVTSGQFLLDSEASLSGIPVVKLPSDTMEMHHD